MTNKIRYFFIASALVLIVFHFIDYFYIKANFHSFALGLSSMVCVIISMIFSKHKS
jgi:hypothetical protein